MKLGILAAVSLLWLLLAGQQNFEVTLKVPLNTKNLPASMQILEPVDPEVQITVRGLRKDASTLTRKNVHAEIDVSLAQFGTRTFRVTRDQIVLPNDRIHVVNIEPHQITFKMKK